MRRIIALFLKRRAGKLHAIIAERHFTGNHNLVPGFEHFADIRLAEPNTRRFSRIIGNYGFGHHYFFAPRAAIGNLLNASGGGRLRIRF